MSANNVPKKGKQNKIKMFAMKLPKFNKEIRLKAAEKYINYKITKKQRSNQVFLKVQLKRIEFARIEQKVANKWLKMYE